MATALIAAAGAAADTLVGPRGEAASVCPATAPQAGRAVTLSRDPARAWPGGRRPSRARTQQAQSVEAFAWLWQRAAPLLGAAGKPGPRVVFLAGTEPKPTPGAVMWVGPDELGCRTIFITPGQRKLLGKRGGNWRNHYAALTRGLHELAHYFQSDEVLYDLASREFGASRWAKAHGPTLLGTAGKRPSTASHDQWRDRDQFAGNYGGDPLSFGWPVRQPAGRPAVIPQ